MTPSVVYSRQKHSGYGSTSSGINWMTFQTFTRKTGFCRKRRESTLPSSLAPGEIQRYIPWINANIEAELRTGQVDHACPWRPRLSLGEKSLCFRSRGTECQIASGQLTEHGTMFINLIPRLESARSTYRQARGCRSTASFNQSEYVATLRDITDDDVKCSGI